MNEEWTAEQIEKEIAAMQDFVRDTVVRFGALAPMAFVFGNVDRESKAPLRQIWVLHLESTLESVEVQDGAPIAAGYYDRFLQEAQHAAQVTAASAVVIAMIGISVPQECRDGPDWQDYRRGLKKHPRQKQVAYLMLEQRHAMRSWVAEADCSGSPVRLADWSESAETDRMPGASGEVFRMFPERN